MSMIFPEESNVLQSIGDKQQTPADNMARPAHSQAEPCRMMALFIGMIQS